jgi:transmembrane sensor
MEASDRRRRASNEAATWWVRLQSEEFHRPDREAFVDWLRESVLHVEEMLRVSQVHNCLEQFQGWLQVAIPDRHDSVLPGDAADEDNVVSFAHRAESVSLKVSVPATAATGPKSRRRRLLGAMVAGLAAAATSSTLFFTLPRGQTIATERGERRAVALPDGSAVDIDPETRLRVAFEKHERRVILEKGRALFRVARNAAKPFVVEADGTSVRAVGTAFGVERLSQGVVITVAEGKVGVFATEMPLSGRQRSSRSGVPGVGQPSSRSLSLQHSEPAGPVTLAREPLASVSGRESGDPGAPVPREIYLTAGQQLTLASGQVEPVRAVDSGRELAWAKGQLVFESESVADAVKKFNRYNRVQLRVTDQALASRPVSGVFDASDPESFIGFLQAVTTVRVTRSESEIIMQ